MNIPSFGNIQFKMLQFECSISNVSKLEKTNNPCHRDFRYVTTYIHMYCTHEYIDPALLKLQTYLNL